MTGGPRVSGRCVAPNSRRSGPDYAGCAVHLTRVRPVAWIAGDGINGVMEGFRRHAEEIEFVLVEHGPLLTDFRTSGLLRRRGSGCSA